MKVEVARRGGLARRPGAPLARLLVLCACHPGRAVIAFLATEWIEIRRGASVFFPPQRPYIPIGSLRRAVTYPDPAESTTSREIANALSDVGLDHLVERLDEEGPWDQTLSGGEKQRLAFARLSLHNPDIVVLTRQPLHSILKVRTS